MSITPITISITKRLTKTKYHLSLSLYQLSLAVIIINIITLSVTFGPLAPLDTSALFSFGKANQTIANIAQDAKIVSFILLLTSMQLANTDKFSQFDKSSYRTCVAEIRVSSKTFTN